MLAVYIWYAHWCVIVQLDDEDKVACRRLNPIHLIQLGDAMLHSSAILNSIKTMPPFAL